MIAREGVENILSEKNHVDKMKLHSAIKMTYKIGYKSALNNSRWRKVSEELPKVRYGETSRVLVADDNFINISVFHISTIRGVDALKREHKFWKPID